jgi:hypothetical protein
MSKTRPSLGTRSNHSITSPPEHDPTQAISDALWSMKSDFGKDPTLEDCARRYLKASVSNLMGDTSLPPFSIPETKSAAMRSLVTAVEKAQPCFADIMQMVSSSKREEAQAMLDKICETHLNNVTSRVSSALPSINAFDDPPTHRPATRARKSVRFSAPSQSRNSRIITPTPVDRTHLPHSPRSGQDATSRESDLEGLTRGHHKKNTPSPFAKTQTSSTLASTVPSKFRVHRSIVDSQPGVRLPSNKVRSRSTSRRPTVRINTEAQSESKYGSDMSGMIPLDEWCEGAAKACYEKHGHRGGWDNAYDQFMEFAQLERGWVDMSQGMVGANGALRNYDGVNWQSWGTDRLPVVEEKSIRRSQPQRSHRDPKSRRSWTSSHRRRLVEAISM